jgi:RES domain-containing protein
MTARGRVHDRAILDALEALESAFVELTVWRVARKGRDPLRGAVANGRWNTIGEFEVLYTSSSPDGALAEVGYRLSIEPIWPSRIEHQIHTLRVKAGRALTFENLAQLERLGVNAERFENFDYTATQAIAAAAHFLEFDALIVPSARYGGSNAVVFLDRLQVPPELLETKDVNWPAWRAKTKR